MSHTLTIPDELYVRPDQTAKQCGLSDVPALLEQWQASAEQLQERRQAVQRMESLRARLEATYGEMLDSTELIRIDRER